MSNVQRAAVIYASFALLVFPLLTTSVALADAAHVDAPPPTQTEQPAHAAQLIARTRIRYYAPETGGPAKPRFISERTLAFFSRIEAMNEKNPDVYDERYIRAATERYVGEDMLSELNIRGGTEPPNLPKLTEDARQDLCDRAGSCALLKAAMTKEGIDESELLNHLRHKIRALFYIDRAVSPIRNPSEEELFEAYRTAVHPYRGIKFEDCRVQLSRWYTFEKLRFAELEFLQGARSRVRVVSLFVKTDAP